MTTADQILLAQTIGVWVAVLAAPATVWAMFAQTRQAARISERGRRQECLEKLLGLYEPGCLQGGPDFYRVLNAVPALFALDPAVLSQYQKLRDLSVQRDTALRCDAYKMLVLSSRGRAACRSRTRMSLRPSRSSGRGSVEPAGPGVGGMMPFVGDRPYRLEATPSANPHLRRGLRS